ncbi:cation efflux protein [Coprinopsis marcescibilis]|uniref:Cation efflux protein n=1 Tax=Coprinopsis marcescibilis TaxID=230819 RepID=A0A5C3LDH0_COPMA|nr:cation efflux protein [Coprinopsis marcescibilis]
MAWSRSTRITILLIIDIVFFFVELIVGYSVGSLALVADSFHMLNDVMSLIVALYAIRLTNANKIDSRYSYGWHRAEILAALVNGVFLLALCFSISLEAIVRFFGEPEISNPKLIVVVGALGLASNLVGLVLFHEHSHGHSHPSKQSSPTASRTPSINDEASAHKDSSARQHSHSHSHSHPRPIRKRASSDSSGSDDDMGLYGHPAATRASLVQTAHEIAAQSPPTATRRPDLSHRRPSLDSIRSPVGETIQTIEHQVNAHNHTEPDETSPLLERHPVEIPEPAEHKHSHGHSHGSMNMQALVLHVMGDALGNVGVIATGLVIWLTEWWWKYYFDPIISLVITVIIFSGSLPLVRSASFILLQGVPPTVSLDEVKDAILDVEGVISLHELHVWQLSENKLVASVHVLASRTHDFMPIAAKIRKALHHLGIHSSTIQPEYRLPEGTQKFSEDSCLILCPADQNCDPSENACCPPPAVDV